LALVDLSELELDLAEEESPLEDELGAELDDELPAEEPLELPLSLLADDAAAGAEELSETSVLAALVLLA
jgi:hypothetical protein